MLYPPRRQVRLSLCACVLVFVIITISGRSAFASGADTVRRGMTILYIEKINYDCYADTIWGKPGGPFGTLTYLPHVIYWGKPAKQDEENSKCKSHIPKNLKVDYTTITYPAWKDLAGSISVYRYNPEDTLADMFFAMHGTVGEGDAARDTMFVVVIFGQYGLDTLKSIDLAQISVFQSDPFTAVELRRGIEVVNEKHRDLSDRKSYELLPVGFRIQEPDTTRNAPSPAIANVRVFPNPTAIAAQVEADRVPAGEYTLEVVAVNGEVELRQEVTVHETGSLLESFDLQRLPSGYYVIRLSTQRKLVGTYPIVVTR